MLAFECVLSLGTTLLIIGGFIGITFLILLALSDANLRLIFKTHFGKRTASLAGKVVWITGASSGIGECIAYHLSEAGCKLVLSARRQDELERVKKACLKSGKCKTSEEDILVLPLDTVNYESHKNAVQQVLEYFNQIDILINNAGKGQRAAWMDVELPVDRELFEVNVLGPVSLTQAVLPHMIQRRQGHIALMSSVAGIVGAPISRSYTGSKHALHGYFDSLRIELSEHNIDVTLICPGPVSSNFFIQAATSKQGEVLGREVGKDEKRMSAERCAYLSCVAIANRMYQVWLAQQPVLLFVYIMQYLPDLGTWFLLKMGLKRIAKMREGKNNS
ncbi:unnamed protein product [Lymnaea stagnalis]|uniref:Dehydrogenase/reductase SDR family member 7 n=1 Tax=Lymnaea stagnalis TaxID=6523 RepID=A0AAV2H5N6_LYMST